MGNPTFVSTPGVETQTFVNADGTGAKTLATGAAGKTKVTGLVASSDDTSARNIQIGVKKSAGSFVLLGTINIPVGAGSDGGAPSVNLLASSMIPGLPLDNDGQPYLLLASGDLLEGRMLVAVTAAKTVGITVIKGDF